MAIKLPSLRINKTWLILFIAVGLALLATLLTTRYITGREKNITAELKARAQQGGPKVSVVVPTDNIPVGTPLSDNMVASREIAADLVYPDAILADDFGKYKGQSLIRSVLKGRPLLKSDLHTQYADFSGSLADGARAMTVDVDELNSVAHLVQPGNRIDLMLSIRSDTGGQTVIPFMDKMKVLAAGQRLEPIGNEEKGLESRGSFSYANLTLEVTPAQAARLTLAQDIGKLRIVLRNEKDIKSIDFNVNSQSIFDEISARILSDKRKKVTTEYSADRSVEYIIGGQRSGPTAKSVSVPVSVAEQGGNLKVPAISPPIGITATTYNEMRTESNGLTPEMKADLKALIEK